MTAEVQVKICGHIQGNWTCICPEHPDEPWKHYMVCSHE